METQATGSTLTVSVPEAFPGGTVALGFVVSPGAGARLGLAVDGEPTPALGAARAPGPDGAARAPAPSPDGPADAPPLDTGRATDPLGGHRNGIVARLRHLPAGAHTITCTVSETAGPVAFDYWQVEPERGAIVLVPLAFRMRDWSHHYSDWPHPPGDADVPALNGVIERVVAEFGERVVTVDLDAVLDRQEGLFSWEGVYPNDEGHRLIAEALRDAVERAQNTGVSA